MKPVSLHLLIFAISLTACIFLPGLQGAQAQDASQAAAEPAVSADVASETAPEDSQASTETPVSEGDAANSDTGSPSEEAAAPEEPAADTSEAEEVPPTKWYRGSVSSGFDGIWENGGGRDIEMDQSLQFQIHPPKNEKLQLRGAIWMIEKLDTPDDRSSALRDLNDTFGERVLARVSHLYLNAEDLWGDSTLRLGRQRILEGAAYNRIDGLYFKKRMHQWDWYVFAGTRATYYSDDFDDPVYGGGISYSPFKRTKFALDAYYGTEKRFISHTRTFHGPLASIIYRLSDSEVSRDVDSVSVALSMWHTVNENLSLFGRFNFYNDQGEEILLSATGYLPGVLDLTYEITYERRFNSVGDRVNDITGYSRLMGTYEAYDNLFVAAYRPITEKLTLSLETELHYTRNSNWSNRDYKRFAAFLQAESLFSGLNLDTKIGVERWTVSEGASSWALVGEVGRRWERFQVSLGADYQKYTDRVTEYNEPLKWIDMARVWLVPGILQGYNPLLLFFDRYTVEMEENIYTFYLKGKWSLQENQDVTAKLTFEEGDGPYTPVWRVQADYTYRF